MLPVPRPSDGDSGAPHKNFIEDTYAAPVLMRLDNDGSGEINWQPGKKLADRVNAAGRHRDSSDGVWKWTD
jgi:hypothetical protein